MHTVCLKQPVPFSLLKNRPERWVYLGADYQHTKNIATQLASYKIDPLPINELFHTVSLNRKEEIIEFLSKTTEGAKNLSEWMSSIASRSAYTCTLIQDVVFLLVFEEIIKNSSKPLLVIVESEEIFATLQKKLSDSMQFFTYPGYTPQNQYDLKQTIHKRCEYIHEQIQRRQSTLNDFPTEPITLISVWLNHGIMRKENPFAPYFGMLADYLAEEKSPVYYLGYIWDHDHHELIKENISDRFANVLFPEDWQTIPDILKSAALPLKHTSFYKNIRFNEFDITGLVNQYQAHELSNPYNSKSLSMYYFFKNLRKQGVQIQRFIYPFENQPYEKASIAGLREFYPDAKTIGFKHTTIPKFMLGHFPTSQELKVMPHPDTIITCGKSSYETLKTYWKPKVEVIEGCALRHTHLFTGKMSHQPPQKDICGVAFSIDTDVNTELLDIVQETAHKMPSITFLLKLHPAADNRSLLKQIEEKNQPNSAVFEGLPQDFLSCIDTMIFSATDLAVQAALMNLPVICYIPMGKLDMNPMDDSFITAKVFEQPALQNTILKLIRHKHKTPQIKLERYYNPVEERYLKQFTHK